MLIGDVEDIITKFVNNQEFHFQNSDFIINALCNAFEVDVVLYKVYRDNIKVSRINPGDDGADHEIHLFLFQNHYELVIEDEEDINFTLGANEQQFKTSVSSNVIDGERISENNEFAVTKYLCDNPSLPICSKDEEIPSLSNIHIFNQ